MAVKQPNKFNTDFKAVAYAAEVIEQGNFAADEVVVLPVGPQERAFTKEIAEVSTYKSVYRNRQMLAIRINREGLYDMLPEGLFHEPPSPSERLDEGAMVKDIKQRREEEKEARRFFAPLETELYHIRTVVELYENRLDKKSEYDELVSIFLKEWKEFKCFTNQQMVVLMHVLPVIHEQRNNLPFISTVLSIMFNINFKLEYQLQTNDRQQGAQQLQTKLGSGVLGVNFIAGYLKEPEEELKITIGPLTAKQMLSFLPGTRSAEALAVLLSYFVPLQTSYRSDFVVEPDYKKILLGATEENSCLGFTTYLGN
jgi:type VI secretion system protein ImpH